MHYLYGIYHAMQLILRYLFNKNISPISENDK